MIENFQSLEINLNFFRIKTAIQKMHSNTCKVEV
jgi:hypothetical protein